MNVLSVGSDSACAETRRGRACRDRGSDHEQDVHANDLVLDERPQAHRNTVWTNPHRGPLTRSRPSVPIPLQNRARQRDSPCRAVAGLASVALLADKGSAGY